MIVQSSTLAFANTSVLQSSTRSGPDLAPILQLHRGKDSYVTFHSKEPGEGFKNLRAVRVSHLSHVFPSILDELQRDALFSINGFWHWDLKSKDAIPVTYATQARRLEHVRYLNAAYCDLDFYNKGLDFWGAFAEVARMVDSGLLPPPSMVLRGRCLWIFWLLHNPENGEPPRAWASNVALFQEPLVNGFPPRTLPSSVVHCLLTRPTRWVS